MFKSEPYFSQKFADLPLEVQQAVGSTDSIKILQGVAQKYGLHLDKIEDLADETWLVMLGGAKTSEFIGNLSDRLKIDRNKASQMASDINDQLFLKIRESLKKIQEEPAKKVEEKPPANTSAAPLPDKKDILQGIESPELATFSGDTMKKVVPVVSNEQAEIIRAIENPPGTNATVGQKPEVQTTAPAPTVVMETRIPIKKIETAPVPMAEQGGPIGEGRLPISPAEIPAEARRTIVEVKSTSTFRIPPAKTQIKVAPRPAGAVDPYKEPIG